MDSDLALVLIGTNGVAADTACAETPSSEQDEAPEHRSGAFWLDTGNTGRSFALRALSGEQEPR